MLAAPAKINLGLRITGRRPDGYHELESVFLPLDPEGPLADSVELALRNRRGVEFSLRGAAQGVPRDRRNLAVRAAEAFLARVGPLSGAVITLEKRVPAGAGLGGGSSDAGAVLRGLRRYHRDALSPAELEELALALGADVPFFLDPEPALVRGIGEQRARVASPSLPLIVTHPGQALATADVFRAFAASEALLTPPGTLAGLPEIPDDPAVLSGELWAERVINDLESTATALCPAIAQLRTRLRDAGARGVGMSGSGPVVYGVFDDETGRDAALARLRLAPPARAWATSTKAGGRHDALRSL